MDVFVWLVLFLCQAESDLKKFNSYDHCPTSMFLVLSSTFFSCSDTERQRNSVQGFPRSDPEIKSRMELEKSSDRKILFLYPLLAKQKAAKIK